MAEEIRICPLGPPRMEHPVMYALCSECGHVRKSNKDCPIVEEGNGGEPVD